MATIEEALAAAFAQHQAGQLPQAETIYRRILKVQPQHSGTLHLLGALCLQSGRIDEAIENLQLAATVAPGNPETLNNLGGALQAAKRWDDSLSVLQKAVSVAPDNAKFHFDLGNSLKALGRHDEAAASFQIAIDRRPDFIQAMNNLGTTLTAAGRTDEAVQVLHAALRIKPDYANAQNALGNALLDAGQAADALKWLQQAAALQPNEAKYHCNLGVAQKALGDATSAHQSYSTALQLAPDMAEARRNLGNLFVSQQRTEDALREFEYLAQSTPDDVDLLTSIGDACRDLEQFDRAGMAYEKAAGCEPDDILLSLKSNFLCPSVFDSTESIRQYRDKLLSALVKARPGPLNPESAEARAVMPPFGLPYHGCDDRAIREAVANLYEPSFPSADMASGPPRHCERIRVGFLVTNGHEGIFAKCMSGMVDRLNRDKFDVWLVAPTAANHFLRSEVTNPDTGYLDLPERFHRMLSPIRAINLDILYYWECGTDLLNYLLPFARPARVQCTGWGLPVTSGIPALDYYLSSKLAEPDNADDHYSEKLLCAETYLTWQEPVTLPDSPPSRADFGIGEDQTVYLCAQNVRKLHPDFDEILSSILRSDPNGTIILAEDRNARLNELLKKRFAASFPDVVDRVVFLPRMESQQYLQLLQCADVALDPLHYGSGITAYELFSVGVPIVTLPGEYRRGRFVAGCYRKMELEGCVATDAADYAEIACRLGTSPDERAAMSAQIRDRGARLFCDERAIDEFERVLQHMVRT